MFNQLQNNNNAYTLADLKMTRRQVKTVPTHFNSEDDNDICCVHLTPEEVRSSCTQKTELVAVWSPDLSITAICEIVYAEEGW